MPIGNVSLRYNVSFYADDNQTIAPSTLVKVTATRANTTGYLVSSCGYNDRAIGVAQVGSDQPSGYVLGVTTGQYAAQGQSASFPFPEQIQVFGFGDPCPLKIGVGGCNPGDPLMSDANANGVVAFPGANVVAIALQKSVAGGYAMVYPVVAVDALAAPYVPLSATATLAATDAGKTIEVTAADQVFTLPVPQAGLKFSFVSLLSAAAITASTASGFDVKAASTATALYVAGVGTASNKVIRNAKAAAVPGDRLDIESDGTVWLATPHGASGAFTLA